MSKNLIIVVLGTLVLLFILDETCIWNFIPDKCSAGIVIDSTGIKDPGDDIGDDICACDNRLRFDATGPVDALGGTTISADHAREYLLNFQDFYKTPKFGAYISKKALDMIFCADPNANGIYCYAGLLEKPKEGGTPDVFIVMEGAKKPFYDLETSTAGLVFRSNSKTLCPDECGSVGDFASTNDSAGVVASGTGH